jgi:nanoRNase/pAp phosphatase (c-di-AMP/oligoRNAs hydrolase)
LNNYEIEQNFDIGNHDRDDQFNQFLIALEDKVKNAQIIVLSSHVNGDVDAISSLVGLKNYINLNFGPFDKQDKEIHIILPQLGKLAQKIYNELIVGSYKIEKNWPKKVDLLILVDTNSVEMIDLPLMTNEEQKVEINEIVIIDHHLKPEKIDPKYNLTLFVSYFSSAAEIITEFYKLCQITLTKDIARILLLGILTDSGHFRHANIYTMDNVKYLLTTGIVLKEVNSHLKMKMGRSEKIARLRAAMRVNGLHYINNYLVVISHVSAYEASASKGLIELGADASFVIAREKKNNKFRISSRASDTIIQNSNLHLGKIMVDIGNEFNGGGGGHDGAAGCYGVSPKEDFVEGIAAVILKVCRKYIN